MAFAVILVLVIVVLGFTALMYVYSVTQDKVTDVETVDKPVVTKQDVPVTETPNRFPQDVPIETGAKITQNYNATAADGRYQATRTFETARTLDANFKLYSDYLKANGWKVEANVDTETYKMLLGSNGNAQLQISINENSVTKAKTVDISYTELSVGQTGAPAANAQ